MNNIPQNAHNDSFILKFPPLKSAIIVLVAVILMLSAAFYMLSTESANQTILKIILYSLVSSIVSWILFVCTNGKNFNTNTEKFQFLIYFILRSTYFIVAISIANSLLYWFAFRTPLDNSFLIILAHHAVVTAFVGAIISSILYVYASKKSAQQNLYFYKESVEKLAEHIRLHNAGATEQQNSTIRIYAANKEEFTAPASTILYFESSGNYVHIHYVHNNTQQELKLRATLSSIAEQLQDCACFVKCHRAFIINARYIKCYNKDTQTIEPNSWLLSPIPVSRQYTRTIAHIAEANTTL